MNVFKNISIEQVRGYWDARPCNIRHSSSPVGTRKYFDEVEARKYFVEPHIPRFAEFEKWRGKKVLEIGCGIGTDTINFARAGARVTALELSEASLKIARKRAQVYALERKIKFYQGDAERLSDVVPVESYDLIYSFGVIHHTPNPENVIREIKKYAKPGTVVKLMLYHRYSWKVFWILVTYGKGVFWNLKELIAKHAEAAFGCPIAYTYTKKDVKELLYGFNITHMAADHIFPYNISDYVQYRYTKVWYFRFLPRPLFRLLEKRFGWHLLITAET